MRLAEAVAAAIGRLTVFGAATAGRSSEALIAGLAFYPAVGLAVGIAAALAATATGLVVPLLAPIAGVVVLEGLAAGRPRAALSAGRGALGTGVALAGLVVKVWAVAAVPAALRPTALAIAPMLGRWAMVVQCYGGRPAGGPSGAVPLVGRARFQEFGWASLLAFAVTLAVAEAVGLVVLLVAALTTLGVRVRAHRRRGGLSESDVEATSELVETAVLVLLGLLASGARAV